MCYINLATETGEDHVNLSRKFLIKRRNASVSTWYVVTRVRRMRQVIIFGKIER